MHLFNFLLLGFQSSASLIMWLLLALFFVALALAIERFWYLFLRCDNGTGTFMEMVSKYIKAGDFDRATKYATVSGVA